jgi:hypothetical protein
MSSNSPIRFPRLRDFDADELARQWLERPGSLQPLLQHPDQVYAPIGGPKVTQEHLKQVRDAVCSAVAHAREASNRDPSGSIGVTWETRFDVHVGAALHHTLGLSRSEAAARGVWSWITLVLLPDVIANRHPATKNAAKLTGGPRNMFSATWWPVEVLGKRLVDPTSSMALSVDEIVGLFERPTLARENELAVAYASTVQQFPPRGRMVTTREFAKLVRRAGAHTNWSVAGTETLGSLFAEAADRAAVLREDRDAKVSADSEAPIRLEVRLGALSLPVEIERDTDSAIQPCGTLEWTSIECPADAELPSAVVVDGHELPLYENGITRKKHLRFRCEKVLANGVKVSATVIRRRDDVYLECRIG